MENLVPVTEMARESIDPEAPSAAERGAARLILGLLLAVTTPFLAPAGLGALWVGVSLLRAGHRLYGALVLVTAAAAAALVVALAA